MLNWPYAVLYFSGDIALRFLNYVKSLEPDYRDIEYEIPRTGETNVSSDEGETTSSSESSDERELPGNRSTSCHVTVCDINQSMLEVGKTRAAEAGITSGKRGLVFVMLSCASVY